jgi:hypothetical protein
MANGANFPENFPIKIRGEIIHPFREHLTFVTPKSGFMSRYFESLARNQF